MIKIAIDGPAGAGKSTIAQKIASKLGFVYIDTGAMYRAVTYKALQLGLDLEDPKSYDFLRDTTFNFKDNCIYLDGKDVSKEIRTLEVTENVSTPSMIPFVRDYLVQYQRKMSKDKDVVMDGRDIGTVVLPDADLKIYLDASSYERAKRRMIERKSKGIDQTIAEIQKEIEIRDLKDSTREVSPLKKADDAVVIDTSNMTIDEVVDTIVLLINERGLLKMSELQLTVGQEVVGTITNVTRDALYLIVGDSKAVIYSNDIEGYSEGQRLSDQYNEGGEFKALIKQIDKDKETGEPLLILSTRLYKVLEILPTFEQLRETEEIISAQVVRVDSRGAYLNYNDFNVYLPLRQSYLNSRALHQLRKEKATIDVVVRNVNFNKLQVTVSQIIAANKTARLEREEAYSNLEVGMVVEGKVVDLKDFGAIIDIGKVTGLLHRTEITHKRVRNVGDYLSIGDIVKVKIINLADNKIGLSMKALVKHPWDELTEKYQVGDIFDGEIVKIIDAGLIIKMTEEVSGLMPAREYSWLITERLEGQYEVGDTIKVKVINIDNKARRITLSHRETKENTWGNIKLNVGDAIKVKVVGFNQAGAQVSYKDVMGFLPIAEITNEKRISKPEEVLNIDDEINVLVKTFEPLRARLVVSAKSYQYAKERETFNQYFKEQAESIPTTTIADLLGDKLKEFK